MAKYVVMNGVQALEVDGDIIAESTSWYRGSDRWVEFTLYKTPSDVYVVSRRGISAVYHAETCDVVKRNKLSAVSEQDLSANYIPCIDCRPVILGPTAVYPETPRNWAQVCHTPRGVIASTMKEDKNGTLYLTNVARRLIEQAATQDDGLRREYLTQYIS